MSSRTRGWVWNLDSLDITFFFSSRRRHTRFDCDWSSDVCSSDLGGVLITEKPIYAYTATEFPPKSLPVSQFEMHAAEDFGIYKFDILSQRGLGHIKETVKHVKRNQGIDVDIYQFKQFMEDEKIKELLRHSKAMGCF